MRLHRRRLLALCAGGVAGCGRRGDGTAPAGHATTRPTPTATRSSATTQSLVVGNSRSAVAFVTVAVEAGDRTVLVESREVVPGERRTFGSLTLPTGTYDVVVETADGSRATYRWSVVDELDGLSVTLTDGIDIARTVRCGSDCPLRMAGTRIETPLIGDGTGRWYAPAQVVLTNPTAERDATLAVSLDEETLVDARYRLPRETRLAVPLTFRAGTYRVVVETDAGRVAGDWRVPEEPSRVVDVATLDVGCGAANTELRLENADDRTHTVEIDVERDGTRRFRATYTLEAGARQAVVPVDESGRYDVRIRLDGDDAGTRAWWACPPQGPATVVVDATGTVALRQAGR